MIMSKIEKTCKNCKHEKEPAGSAHCKECIHRLNFTDNFEPKENDVCMWKAIGSNANWIAGCEPNMTHVVFGVTFFKRCPYCGGKLKIEGGNE